MDPGATGVMVSDGPLLTMVTYLPDVGFSHPSRLVPIGDLSEN